jgi:hypothetical protein
MHTHLSLWRDDQNAFIGDGPYGLSDVATKFIAGLVHHAPEITAITNQWVNSYKRLVPGDEAPVGAGWARYDAAALVRVPSVKPGRIDSTRIEYRSPGLGRQPLPGLRRHLGGGTARRVRRLRVARRRRAHRAAARITGPGPRPHGRFRTAARNARRPPGGVVLAQQALPSGTTTATQVTAFELERYLPLL